jgi:hypothetical protein
MQAKIQKELDEIAAATPSLLENLEAYPAPVRPSRPVLLPRGGDGGGGGGGYGSESDSTTGTDEDDEGRDAHINESRRRRQKERRRRQAKGKGKGKGRGGECTSFSGGCKVAKTCG